MKTKQFKIPNIPPTVNKTIRFPINLIDEVERAIENRHCTFTAFVVEAVRVALDNIKNKKD